MELSPDQKIAGVLTPLFALRSETDLGIGDLAALRQFIDWAAEHRIQARAAVADQRDGRRQQPLQRDQRDGDRADDAAPGAGFARGSDAERDFDEVLAGFALGKLRSGRGEIPGGAAFETQAAGEGVRAVRKRTNRPESFRAFCETEKSWLDDYAGFRTLMEENSGSEAWDQWPPEHRSLASARAWLEEQEPEARQRFARARGVFPLCAMDRL